MQLTLREPTFVSAITFMWTEVAAVSLWLYTHSPWAAVWIAAEVLFFSLRLILSSQVHRAQVQYRRLPSAPIVLTHALWFTVNSVGIAYTVSEPDVRLLFLGTLVPVGFCGYVASRWQAFPRCANLFTTMLCAGLFVGVVFSPIPTMPGMAWLVPAGALAFYVLVGLNHHTLMSALRAEQANIRLSMHDPLTDLPNRLMLHKRLDMLFEQVNRHDEDCHFAVMYLDLDGFKAVNDTHGHAAGDLLLQSVSARLQAAVRANDLVCRVGGDEFVLLFPGIAEREMKDLARRLVQTVGKPYALDGHPPVNVGASIGIAVAPSDARDSDGILAAADGALYRAKHGGKGRWKLSETWRTTFT